MSELADKLREEFRDKEYRHAYADEFLNSYIATQIKVLREQRGWSQERLAQEADMKQSRISVMENVHYSSWSLSTLKRLAEAFDVALRVSFEGFGSRLADISRFSRESLERFSFDEDPAFQYEPVAQLLTSCAATEGLRSKEQNIKVKLWGLYVSEYSRNLKELQAPATKPLLGAMVLQQEPPEAGIR